MINLSASAVTAISELEMNGCKAYLVGGAVRNHIMGIAPDDLDITTNALPEEQRRYSAATES